MLNRRDFRLIGFAGFGKLPYVRFGLRKSGNSGRQDTGGGRIRSSRQGKPAGSDFSAVPELLRQTVQLDQRPDFDSAFARHRDAFRGGQGLIQVRDVDQVIAAELLAGFGKRAVRD